MPHFTASSSNVIAELLRRYRQNLLANSGRNDSARFDFAAGLQIYEYIFEQLRLSIRGHEQVYEELADGLSPINYTENFLSLASTLEKSFSRVSQYLQDYANFLDLLHQVAHSTTPRSSWLLLVPQEMNERDWTLAGELQRSKEQFKVIWEICRFKDTIGRSIPRQVVGAIEGLKRSILPPPRPNPRDLDTFTPAELWIHSRDRVSSVSSLE